MIATPGRNADPERDRAAALPVVIANVSRRRFLQGVSALGGFVLAVGYSRASRAADPPKYGADGMPHGWVDNPLAFVADRGRRHGHHRLPPLRDGPGRAHRDADDRGRGARSRLEACQGRAGARRRGEVRQPGHRRLAQHPALLRPHASLRRRGAHDARGRGRRAVEGAGDRGRGEEPRGRAQADWPEARLRCPGQGRRPAAGPGARDPAPEGPVPVPLHRQGPAEAGRRPRHRDRQGAVRPGHAARRHALRRRRAAARLRRAGRELRRHRRAQGARRREGGGDRGLPRPARLQPAGRRRGHREEYLGGHARPEGAEGRLGRRPERGLRLRGVQGDAGGGRAAAGAGGPQRRRRRRGHGRRRQEDRGGVLHPPPRARDHGAAGGRRPHRSGEVRGMGLLPVPPGHARPGREAAGHGHEGRDRPRDAARRRVRAQVQARLRDRGGSAVPGDGREAGEGRLDP